MLWKKLTETAAHAARSASAKRSKSESITQNSTPEVVVCNFRGADFRPSGSIFSTFTDGFLPVWPVPGTASRNNVCNGRTRRKVSTPETANRNFPPLSDGNFSHSNPFALLDHADGTEHQITGSNRSKINRLSYRIVTDI